MKKVEKPLTLEDLKKNVPDEQQLSKIGLRTLSNLITQGADMIRVLQQQWEISKKEFKLTDIHMKDLYQWNEQHRTPMPENLSEEEKEKFDHYNGMDSITEEEVLKIFGEGHPIISPFHNVTITRIKDCMSDFFLWLSALKEYREIQKEYVKLLEEGEKNQMDQLLEVMEKEADPKKKAEMQAALDEVEATKYLDFLQEPISDFDKNFIVKAIKKSDKITYMINRTRDKMKSMKMSTMFILEISKFEDRYLEEKYHRNSQILLMYFMHLIVYHDMGNQNKRDRAKVCAMVLALDAVITNSVKEETERDRILNNIRALEDQFLSEDLSVSGNSNPVEEVLTSSMKPELDLASIKKEDDVK